MGSFDGYLICSDYDGTLYIDGQISENNLRAIEHFRSEGGLFTFASGRSPEALLAGPAARTHPNAPLITYNGSLIISADGKSIYHMGEISKDRALEAFALVDDGIKLKCFDINRHGASARYLFDENDTPAARRALLDSFGTPLVKMLARIPPCNTDETYAAVKELMSDRFEVTRSWKYGIELNPLGDSKGRAALWLKRKLGCHTLICVGDYDNDLDMIEAADIGYAVGNATPSLKAIADRITVDAREDALAAIIDSIGNS